MSRYVTKKKCGLIIGSDNVFFVTGDKNAPDGVPEFRSDYRAIVWPQHYDFDDPNTVNCFVQTPAQQIIWERGEETRMSSSGMSERSFWRLSWYVEHWLKKHVGEQYKMWDARTEAESDSDCIFFKRRTDALAFVRMIEGLLAGIRFEK